MVGRGGARVPDHFAVAAVFALLGAAPAFAHPHVFVDARAEIVFDPAGEVTAIRHIWQFDPDFSQMATLNLDTNNDGKLTQEELDPLAKINMDSLKEYDFFTYLLASARKIQFKPPEEYFLSFHDQRLTLYYTLPLAKPLPLHEAQVEVYDPEYFVAFTFDPKTAVKLDGAPAGCTAHYQPPHELDTKTMGILAQIPVEQHDLPADLLSVAAALANVITVKCPPRAAGCVGSPPAANEAPRRARDRARRRSWRRRRRSRRRSNLPAAARSSTARGARSLAANAK